MNNLYRIGHSKDTHRLISGRKLILGGIEIPYEKGLEGHSDADVVLHAVAESIIGALALGDIGDYFPDNDDKYLNMPSSYFVNEVVNIMENNHYEVNNIDIIVYLEKPHLKDYKEQIKNNIANLLKTSPLNVNIKATRMEKLGFIGRMEGISAEAVVLLKNNNVIKKI